MLLHEPNLSKEEATAATRSSWIELAKLQEQYLELLKRCPAKLREYRRRRMENALLGVPSVPSGAPRKDALAREALDLQLREKLSYAQIAIRLNGKYGEGTTTPQAVRKLIKRQRPTPDDKT
jgi:hypothetical protein